MGIQRTGFEITRSENKEDPEKGAVHLTVYFDGRAEDRGDALLMILDAWIGAMETEGFDPDSSFMTMRKNGKLQ